MEDLLIPYFTAHGKTFELREPLPRESGLRARVGRALHDVADRIGDLPVLNNYRDILAPILARQAPGTDLDKVFPGHSLRPLALFS